MKDRTCSYDGVWKAVVAETLATPAWKDGEPDIWISDGEITVQGQTLRDLKPGLPVDDVDASRPGERDDAEDEQQNTDEAPRPRLSAFRMSRDHH